VDKLSLSVLDLFTYWWWRPYLACGRGQLRIGAKRRRRDRVELQYRWIGFTWQV
jgi:hypothetical protein